MTIISVIVGSTRQGRFNEVVKKWTAEIARSDGTLRRNKIKYLM
jgi:NAD(P)H-dependent FMN reductase